MTPPRVVVVILTYNSQASIGACLASLAANDYTNFEIVVVDNASVDRTVDIVRAHPSAATLIPNQRNLGYAQGNNVGMRAAMARGAEYIFVLNDDVIVASDLISQMVAAAQAHPNAALLGPLVYHFADPQIIQSAGGAMTPRWEFLHRGQNQIDQGQFNSIEPVAWLTGCAILARRAALEKIGLFDSDFFMYWEDVDWCLRARQAGFEILFVPQAKLWHKGVQMDYQPGPNVAYYSARNELLLLRKHRAGWGVTLRAWAKYLRTIASYTVRPRWRNRRQNRNAQAVALIDFMRGRFGRAAISF